MPFDRENINRAMNEIDGLLSLRNRLSKATADKYSRVSLIIEKQNEEPEYINLGQYVGKVVQQLQGNLQQEIENRIKQLPGCIDLKKEAKH